MHYLPIRKETSVFLQVWCVEKRDVVNCEYSIGELIVNIGGLRRHLLPTAAPRFTEKKAFSIKVKIG